METPHQPERVLALLEEARTLERRGQFREATEHCLAVLALAPEDPKALELLGDLHRHQGDLEAAHEQYVRALAAAPDQPELEQKCHQLGHELAQRQSQRAARPVRQTGLIVTTGNEVTGRQVVAYLGIVRGIVVRSPSVTQGVLGGLKSILGGNIEAYAQVCEQAREDAYERMVLHAQERGADAVIGMRYDATEFSESATEVLAYGTAVRLE